MLKKKERMTGKNYVFEQVTFDKNKTLYSTSNLKGNFTKGFDQMSMTSTQKLFGYTYAKSEGKNIIEGKDVKSQAGGASSVTRGDSQINKRVSDIMNMPSKAFNNNSRASPTSNSIHQNLAMQTFNADTIRPHGHGPSSNSVGQPSNNPILNSPNAGKRIASEPPNINRVVTSNSPNQIHRRNINESSIKTQKGQAGMIISQGGIKSQLANINNGIQVPGVTKLRAGAA